MEEEVVEFVLLLIKPTITTVTISVTYLKAACVPSFVSWWASHVTSFLAGLVAYCKEAEAVHPSCEVAFPLAVAGILEVGVEVAAG